jgi:D-sedoheptulose 7-phosphate isomerase
MAIDQYQQYVAELKQTLDQLPWQAIQDTVSLLHYARLSDKQVFIMGNGGSAATASHMACDLGKNTVLPGRPRFRILALTDNMALFSAHANDFGYENVFAEQLASFVRRGDVVVGISTSGNSPNVLKGMELARAVGAVTIGWSGYEGGQLAQMVDVALVVPNRCVEQIEDVHMMLEHLITTALRRAIAADGMALPERFVPELWGLRLAEQVMVGGSHQATGNGSNGHPPPPA